MKEYRLNRLFHPQTRRCLSVAVERGSFSGQALLQETESLAEAVKLLITTGPDAIQLSIGQAHDLQSQPVRPKPALVLRADVANVYRKDQPGALFSRMIDNAVEQAIRLDAACVVVNLFRIPGEPGITDQCIANILKLKRQCDRWCIPLMIEPLVFRPNADAGGYMADGDPAKIIPLVRQACELGADIIEVDPTDDVSAYHQVVETAGCIPVLVRGGDKTTDDEILTRTEVLMQQGAAGVVDGRNIIQHHDPPGITRALRSIVHEGTSASAARKLIR